MLRIITDFRAALDDTERTRKEAISFGRALDSHNEGEAARVKRERDDEAARAKKMHDAELAELNKRLDLARAEAENQKIEAEAAVEAQAQRAAALEAQLNELSRERDELQTDLEGESAQLKSAEELELELKKQVGDLAKARDEALRRAQAEASSGARLAADLDRARKELADLERAKGMSELDSQRQANERAAAQDEARRNAAEVERLRAQVEEKEKSVSGFTAQMMSLQQQHQDHDRESRQRVVDLEGRLDSAKAERDELRSLREELRSELRDLKARAEGAERELASEKSASADVSRKLEALQAVSARAATELEELRSARTELEQKLSVASGDLQDARAKLGEWAVQEANWRAEKAQGALERAQLENEKKVADDRIAVLETENAAIKKAFGANEESTEMQLVAAQREKASLKSTADLVPRLRRQLEAEQSTVVQLRNSLFDSEMSRRQLHNQVQELKGNIRVYVRVRPFLPADADPVAARALAGLTDADAAELDFTVDPTAAIAVAADGASLEMAAPPQRGTKDGPLGAKRDAKPVRFSFDQVFGQRSSQSDVFDEVSHLVQSALDGYNVCLFSYGQTGSGKTHTMQGASGENAGLIPRSVLKILDTAQGMAATQGWVYSIEASFLEIYNEQIRDLLRVSSGGAGAGGASLSASAGAGAGAAGAGGDILTVHQDADGNIYVPGLTHVAVDSPAAVEQLMVRAAKKRAVAVTNMNSQSSRSHSVFSLVIKGRHEGKGIAVSGSLNLCDLAGSERLSRSGAEGDRRKETQAINKSLSCLADVFTALAKKAPHVPFRNSKLTHLLQKCFKGDGKTLMLVSLSPTMASAQESMCSLRFAAQVSQVELGKPKKRVVESIEAPAQAPSAPSGAASSTTAAAAAAAAAAAWALRANGGAPGSSSSSSFAGIGSSFAGAAEGSDEAGAALCEGFADGECANADAEDDCRAEGKAMAGEGADEAEGAEDELEERLDASYLDRGGGGLLTGTKRPISAISVPRQGTHFTAPAAVVAKRPAAVAAAPPLAPGARPGIGPKLSFVAQKPAGGGATVGALAKRPKM